MSYRILPISESDLPEYFLHSLKVASQSGVDGAPIFSPFDERTPFKLGDAKEYAAKFRLSPDEPGWRRTFALFHNGQIVGDLDFYGSQLHSALHRSTIGMGIQREHAGKGQGEKLLRHGLEWARAQPSIEYIDLHVFSSNTPAIRLYEKCGFQRVGEKPDAFRPRGQTVADILMSLKIR